MDHVCNMSPCKHVLFVGVVSFDTGWASSVKCRLRVRQLTCFMLLEWFVLTCYWFNCVRLVGCCVLPCHRLNGERQLDRA